MSGSNSCHGGKKSWLKGKQLLFETGPSGEVFLLRRLKGKDMVGRDTRMMYSLTKYHTLGDFKNSNLFFSGGYKSKVKVLAGLIPSEDLFQATFFGL